MLVAVVLLKPDQGLSGDRWLAGTLIDEGSIVVSGIAENIIVKTGGHRLVPALLLWGMP